MDALSQHLGDSMVSPGLSCGLDSVWQFCWPPQLLWYNKQMCLGTLTNVSYKIKLPSLSTSIYLSVLFLGLAWLRAQLLSEPALGKPHSISLWPYINNEVLYHWCGLIGKRWPKSSSDSRSARKKRQEVGGMASLVKYLPSDIRTCIGILSNHVKRKSWQCIHMYNSSRQGHSGVCWPFCLANLVSSRFSERKSLPQKIRWFVTEENTQHWPMVSICGGSHVCGFLSIHVDKHKHIYIYTSLT